jgi:hypothetical protein
MEFAALASFAILFLAWLIAPDVPRAITAPEPQVIEATEPLPA